MIPRSSNRPLNARQALVSMPLVISRSSHTPTETETDKPRPRCLHPRHKQSNQTVFPDCRKPLHEVVSKYLTVLIDHGPTERPTKGEKDRPTERPADRMTDTLTNRDNRLTNKPRPSFFYQNNKELNKTYLFQPCVISYYQLKECFLAQCLL